MELLRGVPALLLILVVWLELVVRKINPAQSLAQVFQRITPVDLAAIVLFNLAIGIVSILMILLALHRVAPDSLSEALAPNQLSLAALMIGAVTSTILAPLSEEIVFRGWLLNALNRRMQPWPAIIASSLAFAAIHPPPSLITTFLFGVCAAVVYQKTNNLWVSILIHSLNNLLISAQAIVEHILIGMGLVSDSSNWMPIGMMLGLPSLLATLVLGHYLLIKKRLFNLLVPLSC